MLSGRVPGRGKTNGLAQLFAAPRVQDNLEGNITRISEAIMDVVSFIAEFSFLPPSKIPTYNPILILSCYRFSGSSLSNDTDGYKGSLIKISKGSSILEEQEKGAPKQRQNPNARSLSFLCPRASLSRAWRGRSTWVAIHLMETP